MSDTSAPLEPISAAPIVPQNGAPESLGPDLPVPPTPAFDRPRLNPLAVAAVILGALLSPLAALFGHLAVGQISRSAGRERGLALAWIAVGLGYLWLATLVIVGIGVAVVLGP